jgi:hypothetical protein
MVSYSKYTQYDIACEHNNPQECQPLNSKYATLPNLIRNPKLCNQPPCEDHQRDIGTQAEDGQERHTVSARPKLALPGPVDGLGSEELVVALVASVDGDEHHGNAVYGE